MKAPALGWQLASAFVVSLLVLAGLIGWLQNVHILTANGMYKAIQAKPWITDPANAYLDPPHYLYFPLYGALARGLDALDILRGVAWKQFAYLNAFFASLGIAFIYAFVHRLTGSIAASVLAACFHLGCGFVLLLGIVNEHVMPGYVLVLTSMLLAGLWFGKPNYSRVAIVGALFTLGWLMEWRLIFPTLPALILALAVAEGRRRYRLTMIAVLLAYILAVSGIVQLLWVGHNGAVGLPDLLWTGKGVASRWAPIDWDKVWIVLSGMGNYFLIAGGFADPLAARRLALPLAISVLLQAAILVACLVVLGPRRAERRLWIVAAVFLGTLVAGQAMNLHSQPQDPQMQLNVMPWLTVAWALLSAALLSRQAAVASGRRALVVLAVLSLAPLVWNVTQLSRWRGGDTAALSTPSAEALADQIYEPRRHQP